MTAEVVGISTASFPPLRTIINSTPKQKTASLNQQPPTHSISSNRSRCSSPTSQLFSPLSALLVALLAHFQLKLYVFHESYQSQSNISQGEGLVLRDAAPVAAPIDSVLEARNEQAANVPGQQQLSQITSAAAAFAKQHANQAASQQQLTQARTWWSPNNHWNSQWNNGNWGYNGWYNYYLYNNYYNYYSYWNTNYWGWY